MKTVTNIVVVLATLLAAGAAFAQKVTTDYDRNANFAKYKTYCWVASKNPAKNPLWNQRIVDDVDQQMAAQGLTRVAGPADLYVTYNGGLKENTSLQGFGTGGRWLGGNFSVNKVTEVEGTLIVDLFDVQTRQLVWRGTATETVSDKTDKNIKRLEKVIEKLFQNFPGKTQGGRP